MYDEDKLELLYLIETPYIHRTRNVHNNIRAIFIKNKKGNFIVAHNIQFAANYDIKMICTIHVTQNPTDHYKLPKYR